MLNVIIFYKPKKEADDISFNIVDYCNKNGITKDDIVSCNIERINDDPDIKQRASLIFEDRRDGTIYAS